MAERIKLHPETPHMKRIFQIADSLKDGNVILFPTDSQYALGCSYKNKQGINRIRQIRNMDEGQHLSLMCDSMSGTAKFAHISDANFKVMKRLIPGPYTFILPATKQVPKLLIHPRKKTIGIRVPDYPIVQNIVEQLGEPLLAITAKKKGISDADLDEMEREPFLRKFEKLVDITIDNQQELPSDGTTVVDMTGDTAEIVRRGLNADQVEEAFATNGMTLSES
jgi:tRNA threonylcarbamoyl adenosine modification protein (Sua5/YciO/YrdC/YwlC family)